MRYVHRHCLDRWRLGTPFVPDHAVRCEVCCTEYVLHRRGVKCDYLRQCAVVLFFLALAVGLGSGLAWGVQYGVLALPDIRRAYRLEQDVGVVERAVIGWVAVLGLIGCATVVYVVFRETRKFLRRFAAYNTVAVACQFIRIPGVLLLVIFAQDACVFVLRMACIGAIAVIAGCVYGAHVTWRRAGVMVVQNFPGAENP